LRSFLQALEKAGELHRVDAEVNPDLEVGAVMQRLAEQGGPAVHFRKVTGAGKGVSLAGGLLARGRIGLWSRAAVALELSPEADYRQVRDEIVRRCESPIRPLQVSGGWEPIFTPVQPFSLWLAVTMATQGASRSNWAK
jgi:4-hydroxy-3-polyprenylbenzoate decarboxylase